MFERFTERAVNVVSESQRLACEMGCSEVLPEHLFLALVSEAKGVSLKLFRMYGVNFEDAENEVKKYVVKNPKSVSEIPFSRAYKEILKHTFMISDISGVIEAFIEYTSEFLYFIPPQGGDKKI